MDAAPSPFDPPPPPSDPPPERWLPPLPRNDRLSQTVGGSLRIKCTKRGCTNKKHGPDQFIPELNPRAKKEYLAAVAALAAAREKKDADAFAAARETIDELKTTVCARCRAMLAKSWSNPKTKVGRCKAEWERMKREKFHTCVKCGAKRAIEANHSAESAKNARLYEKDIRGGVTKEAAEKKYPRDGRKLESLSQYKHWAFNGGVKAMQAEEKKCEPLCRMCHALDPSSNTSEEKRTDPSKFKREDYPSKERFQIAKKVAEYKAKKREFNNGLKRDIGKCERLDCPGDGPSGGKCSEGFEQCYDWDHEDPGEKEDEISKLVCDTRCPDTVEPLIEAEVAKCRLLCKNCHNTRADWDEKYRKKYSPT